jgi:peptide/nickel transport system ATP-binding protein
MTPPLLDVRDLSIEIDYPYGILSPVSGVSFSLRPGEMLGLVGESGSGKTLTCRALMGLLPSEKMYVSNGRILLDGQDIANGSEDEMRQIRGAKIGMIFQNPSAFLDPVMTIGEQIGETFRVREGLSRREAFARAVELLTQVGIPDPATRARNYAHEFSGGMRQRAMIAGALASRPKILIADEPTTALDVTVQAQILRLILDLKDRFGLAIILVTHDLGVVTQTCDTIAVMYAGSIVEHAEKRELLERPLHPYTQGLIASQPDIAPPGQELPSIPGQPPSLSQWPSGCRFHPRCGQARDDCAQIDPALVVAEAGRTTACRYWSEIQR